MDKNQEFVEKYLNDDEFRTTVSTLLVAQVYAAIRSRAGTGTLPVSRPAPGGRNPSG
jgi:hypothetical protein